MSTKHSVQPDGPFCTESSAATAGSSSSGADGADKESSEGGAAAAAEKTAEGPPAAPVKVCSDIRLIRLLDMTEMIQIQINAQTQ